MTSITEIENELRAAAKRIRDDRKHRVYEFVGTDLNERRRLKRAVMSLVGVDLQTLEDLEVAESLLDAKCLVHQRALERGSSLYNQLNHQNCEDALTGIRNLRRAWLQQFTATDLSDALKKMVEAAE